MKKDFKLRHIILILIQTMHKVYFASFFCFMRFNIYFKRDTIGFVNHLKVFELLLDSQTIE